MANQICKKLLTILGIDKKDGAIVMTEIQEGHLFVIPILQVYVGHIITMIEGIMTFFAVMYKQQRSFWEIN